MKKSNSSLYYILVFTLAQIAWFFLLGLWIYWYVSNYVIMTQVGETISPQILSEASNISALVGGLILLVVVSVGMSLIFIYLTRQLNVTRMYDNFIANVTHELKSPLSSIQLYLETLDSRKVPAEKQKEFIGLMMNDAARLNKLISSILDISALEKKRIAYNYHVYNVDALIRELIEESNAQFKIDDKDVNVTGKAQCQCVIDRSALKIVINNLFDNAIKYSKEPVNLNIDLNCNDKHAVLTFTDSGVGISQDQQKMIFRKFQRIYNRNIPNVKGTGLGLYWIKEIINYHGGNISVFSEGENKGTTFRIELPIYQTSKKRYINRLLKITRKSKQLLETADV